MAQVHPYLFRGPRPTDLKALQALGFKRVISLQSGVEDKYTDSLIEEQSKRPQDFGIEYHFIKCRNWLPPRDDQVSYVMSILAGWDADVKTYIHCHSGVDRTGFMCAVYRMQIQGWSFVRAYDEWKKEGRHWWFFWWKPFLKRWRNRLVE